VSPSGGPFSVTFHDENSVSAKWHPNAAKRCASAGHYPATTEAFGEGRVQDPAAPLAIFDLARSIQGTRCPTFKDNGTVVVRHQRLQNAHAAARWSARFSGRRPSRAIGSNYPLFEWYDLGVRISAIRCPGLHEFAPFLE